mgnify:CR=1 FL=1
MSKNTRMTPSEAFVETLVAHGVTTVFGIAGSAYMDAMDLFPLAGIRLVSVAHEQNAAHMADGYSRVTNRHGVCIAQNGPGVTNFVTAIAAAYWAHSPVVAITPEAGSTTAGLGGFQETDQMPIFSKITRYQVHVNSPARIAELTHRAFTVALDERGPVQINIPRDYFYGELETTIATPKPTERSAGGSDSLDRAATMLAGARSPVIISGGGVVMADGVDAARRLAEHLSCPVVTSYLHNDAFPASHELACGPLGYQGSKAAMRLLAKADVGLALGSRLGPFGTLPQYGLEYWPASAQVIQVDTDAIQSRIEEQMRGIDPSDPASMQGLIEGGMFELPKSPLQQAALQRLEVVLALVEGWVDEVVGQATATRMPAAGKLQEAVRRRRAAGGPAEETFAALVGLQLRPRRLRDASTLWGSLRSRQGIEGRDGVWMHPDLLPTAADLDDPLGFRADASAPDALSEEDFDAELRKLLTGDQPEDQPGDQPGDQDSDDA